MLVFEVADTGPGIPADQKHRLFQEFDRLDGADVKAIEGRGDWGCPWRRVWRV